MRKLKQYCPSILTLGLALAATSIQAQHAHLNAGALSTEAHSQLSFINGSFFATNSGYVVNLSKANSGPYVGTYQGGITFTALPATSNNGGPASGHAAFGAFLELQIEAVSGPTNGLFGFWEDDDVKPRHLMRAGVPVPSGSVRFALSEGSGKPGSDPFGHVHGRRFTTSQPGLYTVRFRLLDTSVNGPNSGPVHRESEPFDLYFQSGITMALIEPSPQQTRVTFGGWPDVDVYLEAKDSLDEAVPWVEVAGPEPGINALMQLTHPAPQSQALFYRLRMQEP